MEELASRDVDAKTESINVANKSAYGRAGQLKYKQNILIYLEL